MPRYLHAKGNYSRALQPTSSLLAGLGQSNAVVKCVLHDLLDLVHLQHPSAGPRQYVDDMPQRAERTGDEELLQILPPAAQDFVSGLEKPGFNISSKRELTCTKPELGRRLRSALRGVGITVKLVISTRDLGLDTYAPGRVRHRPVGAKRLRDGHRRARRIGVLATVAKQLRRGALVVAAGSQAQQAYGNAQLGTPPKTLRRLSASAAVGTGLGGKR